ncbi:MAG: glycosyltransferase [Anaerolineales bacterium]|nr:glycosyltransferase [Anaerolineales bacterium]
MPSYSIVFLGTQMAVGGAQKLLLEQALWFQARGHKTTVLFFYDRDNLREKWIKTYPFEIQNLEAFDKKAGGIRSLPKLISGLLKLWRILKRGKFDAIITFTHDSNLLGMPLANLAGIRARIGTHLGEIRGMSKWRDALHTFLVNRGIIQTLVASSARTRDNAVEAGVAPDRITSFSSPSGGSSMKRDMNFSSKPCLRRQRKILTRLRGFAARDHCATNCRRRSKR